MKFLYTPFEIAYFLTTENLTVSEELTILKTIWENKDVLIGYEFRKTRKRFLHSVKHMLHKMTDTPESNDELYAELHKIGSKFRKDESHSEIITIKSYLKICKLRLTYVPGAEFCKIKLRRLIGMEKFKRRTASLIKCINETTMLLGLKLHLKGRETCNIGSVPLDAFIIIRL